MPVNTEPSVTKSSLARLGDFFFFHRNWLLALVMILLFTLCKPVYPEGSGRLDALLDAFAVLIILTGQSLRALVIGMAYIHRGGKGGKVWADKLVTEGFFRHCRNPLYAGNVLVYLGLFVMLNNPAAYAIGVPFILLVYAAIVATEESFLRRQFGEDYNRYCRQVNRWIPRLKGLPDTVRGMGFWWERVVLREYGSTYAWMLAVLYLLLREMLTHGGLRAHEASIAVLGVLFAAATVLWAWVRHVKLTGKLVAD